MNRSNAVDGFHFDDDALIYDEVRTVASSESNGPVDHWKPSLSGDEMTKLLKVMFQGGLVQRFEKTGAEVSVNGEGRVDDRLRNVILMHRHRYFSSLISRKDAKHSQSRKGLAETRRSRAHGLAPMIER